jgi:hypothetical protein
MGLVLIRSPKLQAIWMGLSVLGDLFKDFLDRHRRSPIPLLVALVASTLAREYHIAADLSHFRLDVFKTRGAPRGQLSQ